ncbi:MAG: hypothetical protein F2861_06405 [Actinobacteria bacterium]|nr:hypothetical protein [Actinomycetota bacterium]MSW61286.1 hypothetical protein [Actinomycetota bacterium]MSY44592.1 hypothetical protein [Actinomycetota bacterium]
MVPNSRSGLVRLGLVWSGLVRLGLVRLGLVRLGLVRLDRLLALVVTVDPSASAVVEVLAESLLPQLHAASSKEKPATMASPANERRLNVISLPWLISMNFNLLP